MTIEVNVKVDANLWEKKQVEISDEEIHKMQDLEFAEIEKAYETGLREGRKKGEWIPVDSYSAFGGDEETWMAHGNPVAFHYCSECKNHAHANEFGEELLTSFCPECGSYNGGNGDGDE